MPPRQTDCRRDVAALLVCSPMCSGCPDCLPSAARVQVKATSAKLRQLLWPSRTGGQRMQIPWPPHFGCDPSGEWTDILLRQEGDSTAESWARRSASDAGPLARQPADVQERQARGVLDQDAQQSQHTCGPKTRGTQRGKRCPELFATSVWRAKCCVLTLQASADAQHPGAAIQAPPLQKNTPSPCCLPLPDGGLDEVSWRGAPWIAFSHRRLPSCLRKRRRMIAQHRRHQGLVCPSRWPAD